MSEDEVIQLQEENVDLIEQNRELLKRNSLGFQFRERWRRAWRDLCFNRWLILLVAVGMLIWWQASQVIDTDLAILHELQNIHSLSVRRK